MLSQNREKKERYRTELRNYWIGSIRSADSAKYRNAISRISRDCTIDFWPWLLISEVYSATLAIVGRFWVNISYNIGLQYAAEVLPTVVRAQGVALIHIMGYVASILAPFVVYLDIVSPILPLLVLGVMGVLGGLLTLFLPETLDKDLPQTLQDGEDFGKDQKMWDMPCLSK